MDIFIPHVLMIYLSTIYQKVFVKTHNCNRGKGKTDIYLEEMEAIERGRGRWFKRMLKYIENEISEV